MAVLVLLCRVALGGFFAVLGLDLVAGVLPAEQLPAPLLAMRDALADPAVSAPAWRGVTELLAGVMVLGGVWVPLGLLLLAPVLAHVGLHQWGTAPDAMAVVWVLVGLELFLVWAHGQAFRGLVHPLSRSRWGKVQTSKG